MRFDWLRRCVAVAGIAAFVFGQTAWKPTDAASSVKLLAPLGARPAAIDSRLGVDVDDLATTGSVMFTDAMKQASPWASERPLSLDSAGNVRALAPGQSAVSTVFAYAAYAGGDYTLLYDGRGTFAVDAGSGTLVNTGPGRAVVHVTPRPGVGIRLRLAATDPANYARNIRLIAPGFEGVYQSQPFAPAFLARLASFRVLRFVHWSHGDTSAVALSWPARPAVSDFTQAGPGGAAWEYQIALANATGADPWFVIPAGATNYYVTQLAALIGARLDPRLHPAFEYAAGAWRPGSPTNAYAAMAGRNFQLAVGAQAAAVAWYGQRSVQVFALAARAFGSDAARIVDVLGGEAALPGSPADAVDRAILSAAGRSADAFAIDATSATSAAIAHTRALLGAGGIELVASGGALPPASADVTSATRAALVDWRAAGGGLFTASSLADSAVAGRFAPGVVEAADEQRSAVFAAYARAYPAARPAALPRARQSVVAPLVSAAGVAVAPGSVRSLAAAATDVVAVNAGGAAAGSFAADEFYSSAGSFTYTTTSAITTSGVANPAPQAVYASQRTGSKAFTYTLPGLTAGASYTLRLHFAELYFAAAGKRTFNVAVNGAAVLSGFDIFATAGSRYAAVVETFTATANGAGQIVVTFTPVVNDPTVNGLEVLTTGTGPTPTPTTAPTTAPTAAPGSPADVPQYHNDTFRSGWNQSETKLNAANVASTSFGLRQTLSVDGLVMAQPLFIANYPVNGANHNVLVVATEHDSVYAFDADSGALLWRHSLGTSQTSGAVGCPDITPEYGVTSTPVIDRANGTVYVVFASTTGSGALTTSIVGLDLGSGTTKVPAVTINATARLTNGSTVSFNQTQNMQRASLLLANNSIYLGVGSHCDYGLTSISGWLMRYSTANLAQLAAFNTIEDGAGTNGEEMASIWGAGFGPSADASGDIFAVTGNGAFDASSGGRNYGMSVLKFAPDLSSVLDWFSYANEAADDAQDLDFGSGGSMLLPSQAGSVPNILVQMGKSLNIYLLNRSNLGHQTSNNAGALQILNPGADSTNEGIWGGPAYYSGPNGPTVFYQASESVMRAFSLHTGSGKPQLSLSSQGSVQPYDFGGVTPVVSSNGGAAGTGVLWAIDSPYSKTAPLAPLRLEAYDASNVSRHLFSGAAGTWSHAKSNTFVTPLVANGKVYAGGYKTVSVFGLAP